MHEEHKARVDAAQDRLEGKAKEMMGEAEQRVGDLTDDPDLVSRGTAREAEGKAQGFLGKATEVVADAADNVRGAADAFSDKVQDTLDRNKR